MLGVGALVLKRTVLCIVLGTSGALVACGGADGFGEETDARELGSVEFALAVGGDVELHSVQFEITGNGFHKSGSADVERSNRLELRVGGIPAGDGYLVTLTATDAHDSQVSCLGEAAFDIDAGETTHATVHLTCRLPRRKGSVLINGEFNVCPLIEELSILPAQTEIGGSIQLIAQATDSDEQPEALQYVWSSNGGELADPSSASTSLLCTTAGIVTLTISVDDGDCEDALTTTVTCSEPGEDDPTGALLSWNEVESSGGMPDDWAELYNAGDAEQDLSGWIFKDNDDSHLFVIPDGTTVAPGQYLILEGYGFGLGSPDSVRLFDPAMNLVASYSWEPHAPTTYGRCPDVVGEFGITTTPTKGLPNDCSPTIVLNEVESSGGTPGDWVELYNGGLNTTDVSGWVFKDSDDTHEYGIPEGTTIAPGEYLVLDEADFDFGLGSGDSARLFDENGVLVDSYTWQSHATTTYGRCPNGGGDFESTTASTKGTENACSVQVVLNEAESSGGTPGDWVEIVNAGLGAVDVSGWRFKDSDDTHEYTIPNGTVIAPGAFLVLDEADFDFGLGGGDSIRLFDGNGVLVDSYTWQSHATTTYGRCPDGTGDFVSTQSPTKGSLNDCPLDPDTAAPWQGGSQVETVDPENTFPSDLSGLHYQPASMGDTEILWAVDNGQSKLHQLVPSATEWAPAAAWATGKTITYPNGSGRPDTEGVTKAEWSVPGVYVATERNNAASGASRLSVLRVDETTPSDLLIASHEWNLTAQLPSTGANLGLEAITWIPDAALLASGFLDDHLGQPYDPSTYPDHGSGLFVVGVEGTGALHVLALDHTTSIAAVIMTVGSGHPSVMSLEYDRETNLLWAGCDNTCGNETTVLEIDSAGLLTVTARFARPSGLPDINNEGLALQTEASCSGSVKGIFWSDDNNTDGHALRLGTVPCGTFF